MKREEISKSVRTIISNQLGHKSFEWINEEATIESAGGDSLDNVEIAMDIEEDFMITISDEELDKIETVKELIDLVETKLK